MWRWAAAAAACGSPFSMAPSSSGVSGSSGWSRVVWDYPDETFSDYPRLSTGGKKKILGLNAARLYNLEVPAECRPARPATLRVAPAADAGGLADRLAAGQRPGR
jgi:hypothetical protein